MKMEFAHVCLSVADLNKAVAFYVNELGFTRLEAPGDDQFVKADNGISIQLREKAGESSGTLDHLAFIVEDVDRSLKNIDHYGLDQEPTTLEAAKVRTAFIRDPDGTRIELIEFVD